MGVGEYTKAEADSYVTCSYKAHGIKSVEELSTLEVKQVYTAFGLDPALNPYGVIRECCDCAEHPETIPIILGLDVTGSMGEATRACAAQLNQIMEKLYEKYNGIEFMMMGIGDVAYDRAPLQVTQFESDVRILDQTTKIYFEGGGGGNAYESYTAAWYFGLHHTKLDCWKRGKKGIIITMGDEPLNPYLSGRDFGPVVGDNLQDIETEDLYNKVAEKFDVYHIAITDQDSCFRRYKDDINNSWGKLLGQRLMCANSNELPEIIGRIVDDSVSCGNAGQKNGKWMDW